MEHRQTRRLEAPRGQNDLIFATEDQAGRLHNLVATPYGTLRTVVGPCEYVQTRTNIQFPEPAGGRYQAMLGLHHAYLEGGRREVLLAHFDGAVQEHRGWEMNSAGGPASSGWRLVLSTTGAQGSSVGAARNEDARAVDFLTQFVSTPSGVVIVPQDGRAFFYDGEVCLPLGYDRAPGPPNALAPVRGDYVDGGLSGYADPQSGYVKTGRTMDPIYGTARIGTVRGTALDVSSGRSNPLGGVLESGVWRAAAQWVDYFGNLSPVGPLSPPAQCRKEDNLVKDRARDGDEAVDRLRVQFAWTQITPGPEGTVGRILHRTHDLLNSGIAGLYEVPSDAAGTTVAYATLPDNETQMFPDNVPDAWLTVPAADVVPVPQFRVAAQAFGRLWIGNWAGSYGQVRFSMPGRWGTFLRNDVLVPDPRGWDVTGFLLTKMGLLIFTEASTHMVAPNDEGTGFRAVTLSRSAGCVSPNSAQVLPGGLPIWLGREGWYTLDKDGGVSLVSQEIQETVVDRINRAYWRHAVAAVCHRSGEYRCWVPVDGGRQTLCVVFDGEAWRTRDDVDARAVTTTDDHRKYVLALGYVACEGPLTVPSVWVLDHEGLGPRRALERTAVVETTWVRAMQSDTDAQNISVMVWARETSTAVAPRTDFMRDWRVFPTTHTVLDNPANLVAPDDAPLCWGDAVVGGTYRPEARQPERDRTRIPTHWTRRAPYWFRVDTLNAGKVFRARLTVTGDFDFVGLRVEELATPAVGHRPASGRR